MMTVKNTVKSFVKMIDITQILQTARWIPALRVSKIAANSNGETFGQR